MPGPELGSEGYGLGFSVENTETDRIVGHGGGFHGIRAGLSMFRDSGYTAVILANQSGAFGGVQGKIRELIAARK